MILDGVTNSLSSNKKLKFNWSDTSFLARWYSEADKDHRNKLQELVKNGQFQFMGGGWVMNDESLTIYKNAILQIQTGLDWLEKTFGVRPRVGWQIDPFGNSPVTPSILSILGYEGIVLSRIGTTNDFDLENSENSEFIWEGAQLDAKGDGKPILAHHLVRSSYSAPIEFKYQPRPFPFWDHPQVRCSNIQELETNYRDCINFYYKTVLKPSLDGHRHNKVLSVFGSDFAYYDATYNFNYIDKLMEIFQKHSQEVLGKKLNMKYSTVNEYYDEVKNFNNGNIKFPVYKGDFLPYVELSDGTYDHWVGYYSSTPVLKHMIRALFQLVRSIKLEVVTAFYKNPNIGDFSDQIRQIQEEASIMMHHDAITSTSPWGTLADYMNRIRTTERKIADIENKLLDTFIATDDSSSSTEKNNALAGTQVLTIFNPFGYERLEIANFTVSSSFVQLYNSEGKVVEKAEVYTEYLAQYNSHGRSDNVKEYVVAFELKVKPFSMSKFFYKEVKEESK